ncbi:hypothetical protein OC845_006148, partial [Tilletia horrida]
NTTTTLKGINSFGGEAPVQKLDVKGSTPDYLEIDVTVSLNNPSNLTVKTKDVSLPAFYGSTQVGSTIIDELTLLPGNNTVDALFRYQPANAGNAQAEELLEKYLEPLNGQTEPQTATISIHGYQGADTTPYESLQDALNGVSISAKVKGLGARIVTKVTINLDVRNLFRGPNGRAQGTATISAKNVLPVAISLNHIKSAVSGYKDDGNGPVPVPGTLSNLDIDLNFNLKASPATGVQGEEFTSDPIGPVTLDVPLFKSDGTSPQGTFLSNGFIDLENTITTTIDGGYTIPSLKYNENMVPAPFSVTYNGEDIPSVYGNAALDIAAFLSSADTTQVNEVLGYLSSDTLAYIFANDDFSIYLLNFHILCKATDLPLAVRQQYDSTCEPDASDSSNSTDPSSSTDGARATSTSGTASTTTSAKATTTKSKATSKSTTKASAASTEANATVQQDAAAATSTVSAA